MDPNEALRRCREAAAALGDEHSDQIDRHELAAELAEAFQALDAWLSEPGRGFYPRDWNAARKVRR